MKRILLLLIFLSLYSCLIINIKTQPQKPFDLELSSAIGISIKIIEPFLFSLKFRQKIKIVHFVKLDNDSNNDKLVSHKQIINSNYSKDNYFYLLNAKPGRYSTFAVTCEKSAGSPLYPKVSFADNNNITVLFPRELVKLAEVKVVSGEMVFMGNYDIEYSYNSGSYDDVQSYYHKNLTRNFYHDVDGISYYIRLNEFCSATLKSINKDNIVESQFLSHAIKHLYVSGWSDIINKKRLKYHKKNKLNDNIRNIEN